MEIISCQANGSLKWIVLYLHFLCFATPLQMSLVMFSAHIFVICQFVGVFGFAMSWLFAYVVSTGHTGHIFAICRFRCRFSTVCYVLAICCLFSQMLMTWLLVCGLSRFVKTNIASQLAIWVCFPAPSDEMCFDGRGAKLFYPWSPRSAIWQSDIV